MIGSDWIQSVENRFDHKNHDHTHAHTYMIWYDICIWHFVSWLLPSYTPFKWMMKMVVKIEETVHFWTIRNDGKKNVGFWTDDGGPHDEAHIIGHVRTIYVASHTLHAKATNPIQSLFIIIYSNWCHLICVYKIHVSMCGAWHSTATVAPFAWKLQKEVK